MAGIGSAKLDLVLRPAENAPATGAVATIEIPLTMGEPVRTAEGVAVSVTPDLSVLERLRAFLESE